MLEQTSRCIKNFVNDNYLHINTLVGKCKNEDNEALFELFEFYKPLILSSVKRCINKEPKLSRHREDIFRESIFVLKKLIDQYDPSLTYFSYFLSTRIDINLFRFVADKYQTFSYLNEETCESEEYHDPFNQINNMISVHAALDKLNDKQREAIELYFFDGLDQEEASLKLNITQSSFSKRLQRGLSKMKELLGDDFLLD